MAVLGSTSLTGCNSIPDFIAAGTLMLFQQTAAPTSWTKDTTSHNNKALRVVTGTASPGGTTAFTSVFTSRTPAGSVSVSGSNSGGSVGNTTLTESQIPSHVHSINHHFGNQATPGQISGGETLFRATNNSNATGGSGAHAHPFTVPSWSGSASFTGTAQDFAVQYVDVIIASKN